MTEALADNLKNMNEREIWDILVSRLGEKFLPHVFESWISGIKPVSINDKTLVLQVPDSFSKEWISKHYLKEMLTDLKEVFNPNAKIVLNISSTQAPIKKSLKPKKRESDSVPATAQQQAKQSANQDNTIPFNSRYIFDTFIIGSSNQFAHAACRAVADSPSKSYNPLFLYGDSGLGKTHLLQAIGQHILKKNKNYKVIYISAEEFTNQLIDSIKNKTSLKFRNKYRKIDLLLIDDIHFLSGKEQTQEEFFHTFNTLYTAHKQIVLSSDRSPKELKNMEDRLVSRFEWGLIADLQPPDMETRIAILRKKAESLNIELADDIAMFIASNIKMNIRKLEGSLIRLYSYSSLTGTPVSINMAREILKDIIVTEQKQEITVELIQKKTAEFFDIRVGDIKGDKRPKNIAVPRQIAMFIARELTTLSLKDIGDSFGGKDHTTVIHAIKTITKKSEADENIKRNIALLKNALKTVNNRWVKLLRTCELILITVDKSPIKRTVHKTTRFSPRFSTAVPTD